MKKVIPISALVFIALGIISIIFINPQKKISHEEAFTLLEQALNASEDPKEEAYFWRETRNWMTLYDKFYDAELKKSDYPQWFDADGNPLLPDKFIFRVVNVYGEKENQGDYNFIREDGLIKNYGFYIREEMSFGKRKGGETRISDEKRTVFNKIIGVNASINAPKDFKNYLFEYHEEGAMAAYNNANAMFHSNYSYTNPNFKGGWGSYKIDPPEDLGSNLELFNYYKNNYESTYGLKTALSELRLLSNLANASLEDYVDFDIKEAVCSTNYENITQKPLLTKIAFKIKDKYFEDFEKEFPGANGKYDSAFAGADYVELELLLGKVSQIVCYVKDIKPTLGFLHSPTEVYTLQINYLGPKITKPAYNVNGRPWYENLSDQW
ncbi:MAG: hypothetical protein LBP62_00370 [Clostridiales bacterium]|jgi:hypothetical protein|nr:hypothetical protein [Clostridiales bacterium]